MGTRFFMKFHIAVNCIPYNTTMKSWHSLLLIFLTACLVSNTIGAKIVVVYSVSTKSHVYAVMPVLEELGKKGHQVTVFTPYEGIAKKVPNVREFFLSDAAKVIEETQVDWFAMQEAGPTQIFSVLPYMKMMSIKSSENICTHPEFLRIVKNRDVDLFLIDGLFHEFLFPIFDHIGVPFVTHSSSIAFPQLLSSMGAPIDYASVPTSITEFDDQMTFFQRLVNIVPNEIFYRIRNQVIIKPLDELLQVHFPGVKSILELEGEASICLLNNHPTTNWVRSLPPNVIPVGALHTRPARPLPETFKEFADGAQEGFITFSLGSFIPVSSMPKKIVDTFIRVFSKLPQRVVWKWEGEIPKNVSPNIKMVSWLPQQDLLGHPNARVFISHGGMLGTQEAAYHGVPILGLPFGNDQRGTIAKAVHSGWGFKLNWNDINDQSLYDALTYLIHDANVRANATKVSQLMRDEILPGVDTAVYWIEYVIRNGGTKHMQSSSKKTPFYQLYLFDVVAFLVLMWVLALYISFIVLRVLLKYLFTSKQHKQKTN